MEPQLVHLDKEFDPKIVSMDLDCEPVVLKPNYAPWSSTAIKLEDGTYTSRFLLWAEEWIDRFQNGIKYLFIPKKNLKVFEIRDIDSMEALVEQIEGRKGRSSLFIDFKKLHQEGYDAIHLTKELARHRNPLDIDKDLPWDEDLYNVMFWVFFHWDAESTVYLRPDWYESYELVK